MRARPYRPRLHPVYGDLTKARAFLAPFTQE